MGKFILTEEDRNRIRNLYGLLNEQNVPNLPYVVEGSHTVPKDDINHCDAFHGFQLKRNPDATMHEEVSNALNLFKGQGVWVENVEITETDVNKMKVSWKVTINKSQDGKFWNGFTSRGAGCGSKDLDTRWDSKAVKNDEGSIVNKIISTNTCKSVDKIELVKKIEKRNLGGFSFIQGFYRYRCGSDDIQQTTSQNTNSTNNVNEFEIFADNPQRFLFDVKTKSQNQSIDTNSVNLIFDTSRDSYKLKFKKGNTIVKYLTVALNMVDDEKNKSFPSRDTILSKNPGSFVVKENVFNDANGKRRWAVIAIV